MNEMPKNTPTLQGPLQQLTALGQSLWLDSIDRHLIASGELARLVNEGSVRGLTSNPAIFQKAMAGQDYRDDIGRLRRAGRSALEVYETLAIADLQAAADIFRPLYEQSGAADGYVSFEVAPSLAHDAAGTVAEAQRLWRALERPNAMIKVPGTPAGIEAREQLIPEGINVNVTLLFSTAVYAAVAKAYMRAIARRHALGLALRPVASVASFFVSRVDSKVDAELDRLVGKPDLAAQIAAVRGQAAIANAKVAWAVAGECYATAQWQALAAAGAQPQRLLWASTGNKNPAARDVRYIEELIGPDTVNTVPPATLAAFADHGRAALTLSEGQAAARLTVQRLAALGIDIEAVAASLLQEGLQQFEVAFVALIGAVTAVA